MTGTGTTSNVRLGDVPTDVLVTLVDDPSRTLASIAGALQATSAVSAEGLARDEVTVKVAGALRLLKDLGLADWRPRHGASGELWSPTREGQRLVKEARAAALAARQVARP